MKLKITIPSSYKIEREYVLNVILKDFLGIEFIIQRKNIQNICITNECNMKCLLLPDVFFAVPQSKWLNKESMPPEPLELFDLRSTVFNKKLYFNSLPIIYGQRQDNYSFEDNCLRLPIDILGSVFFMLTRYEEIVIQQRDGHDRFPAIASLAFRNKFLDRPIVDEYVELLWEAFKLLWPGIERKKRAFSVKVTCDVDEATRYGFLKTSKMIRAIAGDIIKRRDIAAIIKGPWIRINSRKKIHPMDLYNSFDFIMNTCEQYNLSCAFYFICKQNKIRQDDIPYVIEHPSLRLLLRNIHARGHEIGLHPSYNTYRKPESIISEADYLRRICSEEGIKQDIWGGRMHFLQWEMPTTLYGWERAGMSYDSSMSYADHAGFRCGTCHEYPAFDPVSCITLNLLIRPLIAMECTVIDRKYMGYGLTQEAYFEFKKLKNACRRVNGVFTLLWHNTRFTSNLERKLFEAVISDKN